MKKLLLPICIIALVALVLSAFAGKTKPAAADDGPRFSTVSEAAFSMRATGAQDATSFLVGSFTGEHGEKLVFNGAGEVKRVQQNLSSVKGIYSLLQSKDGAAILNLDIGGSAKNYSFVLTAPDGSFIIRDADGNAESFAPVP